MSSHDCILCGTLKLKADVAQQQIERALTTLFPGKSETQIRELLDNDQYGEVADFAPPKLSFAFDLRLQGGGYSNDRVSGFIAAIDPLVTENGGIVILDDLDASSDDDRKTIYPVGPNQAAKDRAKLAYALDEFEELVANILSSSDLTSIRKQATKALAGDAAHQTEPVTGKRITTIRRWDSVAYGGDILENAPREFDVSVDDRLDREGQMYIDVAPKGGSVDDILSMTIEASTIPGTEDVTQTLHVHFDSDNLAFSLFKQGDKYILRPEAGVAMIDSVLGDGTRVFIVE